MDTDPQPSKAKNGNGKNVKDSDEEVSDESLKIDHTPEHEIPKFNHSMKLAILNAAILTAHGTYSFTPCPVETARILANSMEISSHVGHESTAKIISDLLNRPVSHSRKELKQKVGQIALVFSLKKRAPEGKILTQAQLEEFGYEFKIMYRSR